MFLFKSKFKFKDIRNILPIHKTRKWKRRKWNNILEIIIHHSATTSKKMRGMEEIENIAIYHKSPGNHISKRGCPGICYHWVISRDGIVFKTSDHENITWHCSRHNSRSVGICLLGNFTKGVQKPTLKQLKSLDKLLSHLLSTLKLSIYNVFCHRDFKNTICPGDLVYYFVHLGKEYPKIFMKDLMKGL